MNPAGAAREPALRSRRFGSRTGWLARQDGGMPTPARPIARVGGAVVAAGIVWLAVRFAGRARGRSADA